MTKEDLGGAKTHSEVSGISSVTCKNEDDCFERVRELLGFIPPHNFFRSEKNGPQILP